MTAQRTIARSCALIDDHSVERTTNTVSAACACCFPHAGDLVSSRGCDVASSAGRWKCSGSQILNSLETRATLEPAARRIQNALLLRRALSVNVSMSIEFVSSVRIQAMRCEGTASTRRGDALRTGGQ